MKKIGILTSGGDCAGLNAVLKGAAQMANSLNIELYIIPCGYAGLYNLHTYASLEKLDAIKTHDIPANLAGSIAGHSRVKISKIDDSQKYEKIKQGLKKFEIEGLIIAGGDDTGSVVVDLGQQGIPCIHVPKTMDLDLQTYSVGGDTAINRIASFLQDVKTTGLSHSRVMIVEAFGRYAGHTMLQGGLAGEADCILLPEVIANFDVIYEHMKNALFERIKNHPSHIGTYTIVVTEALPVDGEFTADETVSTDAFGHKKLGGSGKFVRQQLSKRLKEDNSFKELYKSLGIHVEGMNTNPDIRESVPAYLIRSGNSTAIDICFGKTVGAGAICLLNNNVSGVTITGIEDGNITYSDTDKMIKSRQVSLQTISFYEQLGICFGRKTESYKYKATKTNKGILHY